MYIYRDTYIYIYRERDGVYALGVMWMHRFRFDVFMFCYVITFWQGRGISTRESGLRATNTDSASFFSRGERVCS